MGLLDDAIREHLELKRRRGADPGEIAHQERAALEAVFPDEQNGLDVPAGLDGHPDPVPEGPVAEDSVPAHEPVQGEHEAPAQPTPADAGVGEARTPDDPQLADFSPAGQETAELDMQAVLEEDARHATDHAPADPLASSPSADGAGEDSLEWEFPSGSAGEQMPEEVPGQERLSFE